MTILHLRCSPTFYSTHSYSAFYSTITFFALKVFPLFFCPFLFHHDLFELTLEDSSPLLFQFFIPYFYCAITFLQLRCPHHFLFCPFLFCHDLFELTLEDFPLFILYFYFAKTFCTYNCLEVPVTYQWHM